MVMRNANPTTARRPVRLSNAACGRCDGPVYWSPARKLHCPKCPPPAVRVALTPAGRQALAAAG